MMIKSAIIFIAWYLVLQHNFHILLTCKISEFSCHGGALCLPLDKYCDGKDDCGDKSDEPKYCTACNRTYYGDVGRTYSLRIPPPQWNRLPFLCHLTFTASGHDQGDIVQIIFDEFSVGRFDEGLVDNDLDTVESSTSMMGDLPGCPEGFMQLSELGRPFTGGSWCGTASGHQLYFSETSTVTASVKVFHAPLQAATPFEFRIRYKFISQSDAIVRYGEPNELLELGRVTPGTYCTRQFDECYRKKCRLQSPNYPGMYPRNVTCYWTIRQKIVPTCKHAMVSVSQENEHKALVKRSIASFNKTSRSVRAWSDCTGERDHLIFYDGSSTNDPVLAKYCGGDWLPKVISRGQEMLIAFHSSPFSAPLQTGIPNRGFELDVDILFADSDSQDFAPAGTKCEFFINATNPDDVLMSRRGRMGNILSPRHTLPPNTTCTYYFYGFPTDLIWISFTSYHLQILQPTSSNDNSSLGRNEIPPWITRLRIWDSVGTHLLQRTSTTSQTGGATTTSSSSSSSSASGSTSSTTNSRQINHTALNYFSSLPPNEANTYYGKLPNSVKFNIDNAWNPVDSYIYGPTSKTIFNQNEVSDSNSLQQQQQQRAYQQQQQKFLKFENNHNDLKETINQKGQNKFSNSGGNFMGKSGGSGYVNNIMSGSNINSNNNNNNNNLKDILSPNQMGYSGSGGLVSGLSGTSAYSHRDKERIVKISHNRKLVGEFYDNETPKLCDHTAIEKTDSKMRPCTPLESYVSTGNNMKIEFSSYTGTSLFPAIFSMKYEFIDTELGGEVWQGKKGEEPVPYLCSRVFKKRRGDVRSPRNSFLHGRGGAKNISCLYRFEAAAGERIRITLHNISFGESATCATEPDLHTGRHKCSQSESDQNVRIGELKLFDVPHKDLKIPLGCFCDNTTSQYNSPIIFQSNSRTMELTFVVTKLNISEDFADVYFHASYEFVRVTECRKRLKLRGSGGEDEIEFPLKPHDSSCYGLSWFMEAQHVERSLFALTWGSFLPVEPSTEENLRCNTKNRLIIYSGRPLKVMRVICPSMPGSRTSALHIFSEDWLTAQPLLQVAKPVNMVLEPILKEPGNIAFSWLEIQRTKSSLIQQLDIQTNFTANDTLEEFGLYPKDVECQHKCPELDACIGSVLWCDGRPNCPSGYDESEEECGSARKLLELPGGIFAALGCIAAAISACLIFCILGLVRKRKKSVETKIMTNGSSMANGTLHKNDYKKEPLFFDAES